MNQSDVVEIEELSELKFTLLVDGAFISICFSPSGFLLFPQV